MFYVTSFALEETSYVPFAAILIGFIAASFSIAATNGGIGSYPEAVVLAFTLFNIPEDPSRAFGWIMWGSQTLLIIVFGGLSLIYLPIFNRKKAIK
ncbi:putative dolichol-P-glucose synthetase [Jejuia pallidilutea]|nr:putative dolichol-P-glucose synthetase [Jejuia pallidilutea]